MTSPPPLRKAPGLWAKRASEITCTVHDTDHDDLSPSHQVHQSIVPDNQLAKVLAAVLRHHSPHQRFRLQAFRGHNHPLNFVDSVDDRISRNKVSDLNKVLLAR